MFRALILFIALLFGIQCYELDSEALKPAPFHIRGITMVAPPQSFSIDPIEPITRVNANWIAVIPYAYTPRNQAKVVYGLEWQWWGEKEEGIRESIHRAKEQGLNVMMKPQVYIHGSWVGDMDFSAEEDWLKWQEDYKKYILQFARIAEEEGADMFCVGTEFKISVKKREKYWRELIQEVRSIFKGHIIYSANWDAFEEIPIWDAVDFIGISSYFPLSNSKTPKVSELKKAWKPIAKKLERFSTQQKKHIIFTEFGYLTVDHCAHRSWELEQQIGSLKINQQAQANAFEALFSVFWPQDYWAGGFIWKWFPNMQGHEGYPDKDYTPQGKKSQKIIEDWYAAEK